MSTKRLTGPRQGSGGSEQEMDKRRQQIPLDLRQGECRHGKRRATELWHQATRQLPQVTGEAASPDASSLSVLPRLGSDPPL